MITLVQRVAQARVTVDGAEVGAIDRGLLLLVGVEHGDTAADADAVAAKLTKLRAFPGRTPLDRTVAEVGGSFLVVSQFTLAADLRHGNRPDFTGAAPPELAEPLYERVAAQLRATGAPVATGRFGASMLVESTNEGPVTLILEVRGGRVQARHRGADREAPA